MLPIRTILYPTNYSDRSRPVFDLACTLARDYGATLVVWHVSPLPVVGVVGGVAVELPTGWAEEEELKLRSLRPADAGIRVCHRLRRGDTLAELLRVAIDLRADLIVMGTHGRSGLSRLLMGSLAEHVMRKAPCPVVTVRAAPVAG